MRLDVSFMHVYNLSRFSGSHVGLTAPISENLSGVSVEHFHSCSSSVPSEKRQQSGLAVELGRRI